MTTDFNEAYARIQSVTGTQTQVGVAALLGIRQSSISDAKRRGEIPAGWLVTLLEKYSVNPTWIKTGKGQTYVEYTDAVVVDGVHINWAEMDEEIKGILNVARINIACAMRSAVNKGVTP